VCKGAERPIPDEHITRLEFAVREGCLGDLVRSQWRGQEFQEQTRAGVEQSQDAGNRDPASRGLIGRLPERGLQHGSVGHRDAGAVDEERPQPPPPPILAIDERADRVSDSGEEVLKYGQRQSGTGLAVRGGGERPPGQMREVGAGGVAVEDLEHEQVNGRDRVQNPIPPCVTDGRACPADRRGSEHNSEVVAKPPQRGEE